MPFVMVDLDGCLFNDRHRRQWLVARDWERYHSALVLDKINPEVELILRAYYYGIGGFPKADIAIITGRPIDYRQETESMMFDNHIPYDKIVMRKAGDFRSSTALKKEAYLSLRSFYGECILAIDDRKDISRMWESLGVPALQIFQRR